MKYGIGYKGSKSRIADRIIKELPQGNRFVDLFAGGCAMAHCALLSGKYKACLLRDISDSPRLYVDAIAGKYIGECRWISREVFLKEKDNDPYIRIGWSFGNGCEMYMYSKALEPYKRAMHYAIVDDEWTEYKSLCPETYEVAHNALTGKEDINTRRLELDHAVIRWLQDNSKKDIIKAHPLYRGSILSSGEIGHQITPQHMQFIQRLNKLTLLKDKIEKIETEQGSYENYKNQIGDVVYADPPYITDSSKGKQYGNKTIFSKKEFCEWAKTRNYPVWISEYEMPDDFICVATFSTKVLFGDNKKQAQEKLFIHQKWRGADGKAH